MIKRVLLLLIIAIPIYFLFNSSLFESKIIKIGTSLPLTGINKSFGKNVVIGANAYFQYANEKKLLGEKQINFIQYDDKYEPSLTLDNIEHLIKDNVFSFFGFVGTPTVKTILPRVLDSDIPFFAPFTGASFLRDKKNQNIINIRSSYKDEIESIITYLYTQKNFTRYGVFYQNDDYGEEGYIALVDALEKKQLSLVAEGSYKRNTLSISHAFDEIKNKEPQAILLIGAYKANALFIKKAKNDETLKNAIFCNISFGDANTMIDELKMFKTDTKNLIFSQVVPNYLDSSIPLVQEYQSLMKHYYPNKEYSFISLEAFLAAKILIQALQTSQTPLNKDNFIEALQKINKTTQLQKSYLFIYENNKFQKISQ